jgi:hypothetical protein
MLVKKDAIDVIDSLDVEFCLSLLFRRSFGCKSKRKNAYWVRLVRHVSPFACHVLFWKNYEIKCQFPCEIRTLDLWGANPMYFHCTADAIGIKFWHYWRYLKQLLYVWGLYSPSDWLKLFMWWRADKKKKKVCYVRSVLISILAGIIHELLHLTKKIHFSF